MAFMPCGVDIGLEGGLAALDKNECAYYFKVPVHKYKVRSLCKEAKVSLYKIDKRSVYDQQAIYDELVSLKTLSVERGYTAPLIVVETPQMRTGLSSPVGYFSTGGCLNTWLDAITSADIPFFMVAPITWKTALGLSNDKDASIQLVQNIGLDSVPALMKLDDNMAEAALIAHWLRRSLTFGEVLNGEDPYLHDRDKRVSKPKRRVAGSDSKVRGTKKLQGQGEDRKVRGGAKKGVGRNTKRKP